jgi:glycosyltransferase involved in cell wall biosynthesis
MSISFAVTAYNEMSEGRLHGQRILDCIQAALEHEAVDEVVVMDDGSDDYNQLVELLTGQTHDLKLKLWHNVTNFGVFVNKIEAVILCSGDWVITSDSDNIMDKAFIDRVVALDKKSDTWYCSSFAKTHFEYRELVGLYDLSSIHTMLGKPLGECCGNTGNQTVHRKSFIEVFGKFCGERADLLLPNWLGLSETQRKDKYWRLVFDACDSLILNMQWLYAGNRIQVTEGLEYDHYYAAGPEGNYTRAPVEKGRLGEILVKELRERSMAANDDGVSS